MAKIFMSVLGTNDYLSCNYYHDNEKVQDVRFVQEANLRLFCKDWNENDRGYIFVTDDACNKNWKDNGQIDFETKKPKACQGLSTRISECRLPFLIERIHIPEGFDEKQIWEIFQKMLDVLEEKDEVFFDITHAFRSIPMLALVTLNYAKVLKNISLLNICYGAFEILGPISKAAKKPLSERNVPILDLTSFDRLLEWSFAVNQFIEAGNASLIKKLAQQAVKPILVETRGKDADAGSIRSIANALEEFSGVMSTCRSYQIGNAVGALKKYLNESKEVDLVKPFYPLFDQLEKHIGGYNGDPVHDGLEAAIWCKEHNLTQQAITILREVLITHALSAAGYDPENFEFRELVSEAVNSWSNKQKDKKEKKEGKKQTHDPIMVIKDLEELFDREENIAKLILKIREPRNDINHAGIKKAPLKWRDFDKKINGYLEEARTLFEEKIEIKSKK